MVRRSLETGRRLRRRADVGLRQIEREGAALAGRAAELNFAAEQAGEFAADGEAEAGAAVLAAGAGVGLLEGLEDDALLFRGMPMPVSETSKAMTEPALLRIWMAAASSRW